MKVFLRSFNPHINSKTGEALPYGQERSGTLEWKLFESILKNVLVNNSHEVLSQLENSLEKDQLQGANYRIYAHKTKRDIPDGDLFYMQMHLSELFTIDHIGWGADHSRMQDKPEFEKIDVSKANLYCEKLKNKFRSGP